MNQKIIFLGHDASRTGAPLLLLEIIRWLRENSLFEIEICLKSGGALEADYSSLAPTFCPVRNSQTMFGKVIRRLHSGKNAEENLAFRYPVHSYPVVYANTIDSCQSAIRLANPMRRIIHHIHEMAYATNVYRAKDILRSAVPHTDFYIAVSDAVKMFLMQEICVPEEKIRVIHGFPIAGCLKEPEAVCMNTIREKHGIPSQAFVIGMCGSPEWRKGTDLFVRLVQQVLKNSEGKQCHFVWLGGERDAFREYEFDIGMLGLHDFCHFVPSVQDAGPYFEVFDIFALTSREDPFPLVMLEAAARGLPIVCFADSGGAAELVENDAGVIVPYLDVQAMADACIDLMLNDGVRRQFGERGRIKVETRYLLAQQGPKIQNVIESAFESVRSGKVAR